jgi:hypothetical protein
MRGSKWVHQVCILHSKHIIGNRAQGSRRKWWASISNSNGLNVLALNNP